MRRRLASLGIGDRFIEVARRVALGTYDDGFMHAGNLAYLSLLTLFPFFIVAASIAQIFGRTGDGLQALNAFLQTVPPEVAVLLQQPITDVLAARAGSLVWFGVVVGLWTTASFVETVRLILRRAYGVTMSRPFWEYRLGSVGLILASVILVMVAFSFQVILTGAETFITRLLPFASDAARIVSLSRIAPAVALFGALYMLFYTLTPSRWRWSKCPKWPGPLVVTIWWNATTALLPPTLGMLGGYDRTYGSLAGVMIALIFFFIIGLGVVIGAELNAALAEVPENGLEDAPNDEKAGAA
ncbi:YihY/virulence factor BrkB family protein [Sphingomonas sp. S1-29]|uniref:YihY/virulence factor BrkB family protein n=1 Tax=Sphingomonas sp. S1-29 TaxID=2991074 RepID=UPI00223FD06D|nr:YihY/virulence factor BrkB family protein [Sphingomonas sp. S1-29]UZK71058.1 YihY/virulence factor BrkB family protein [Sphingomonas sp. S1-29]